MSVGAGELWEWKSVSKDIFERGRWAILFITTMRVALARFLVFLCMAYVQYKLGEGVICRRMFNIGDVRQLYRGYAVKV